MYQYKSLLLYFLVSLYVCCICICIFCICWWAQDVSKGNPGFGFGAHSLVLPEPKMGQVCPQQRTLHHLLFYFRSVFWYSETLLWFLDEIASPAPNLIISLTQTAFWFEWFCVNFFDIISKNYCRGLFWTLYWNKIEEECFS